MSRYSGRLNLCLKSAAVGLLMTVQAHALEPVDALDAAWVEEALAEHAFADQAWSVPAWSQAQGMELQRVMDEQIFTELSPILDTGETIRLPQDQLLVD